MQVPVLWATVPPCIHGHYCRALFTSPIIIISCTSVFTVEFCQKSATICKGKEKKVAFSLDCKLSWANPTYTFFREARWPDLPSSGNKDNNHPHYNRKALAVQPQQLHHCGLCGSPPCEQRKVLREIILCAMCSHKQPQHGACVQKQGLKKPHKWILLPFILLTKENQHFIQGKENTEEAKEFHVDASDLLSIALKKNQYWLILWVEVTAFSDACHSFGSGAMMGRAMLCV